MATFKEHVNEASSTISKEIEQYMFKMDPKEFIKQAKNIKDKSWYWLYKPNFNTYLDQNGLDSDSYSIGSGSLVEVFRNYRYGGEMMSKKMKDYIDKSIDINDYKIPDFDKTYIFKQDGEEHTFRVWFDNKDKMKRMLDSEIKNKMSKGRVTFSPRELVTKFFYSDYIKGQIDGKGTFSFSTYRNRKKLRPASGITKKDLYQEVNDIYKQLVDYISGDTKWRELVTQVMLDKVIGDNYIVDNSEMINKIKNELVHCKTGADAIEVLNRYDFEGVPSPKVVEELISSEDFSYSESTPDGYGHQNVTIWKINFEKRFVRQTFGNSGD